MKVIFNLAALFATTVLVTALPSDPNWTFLSARQVDEAVAAGEEIDFVDLQVMDEQNFPGQSFQGTVQAVVAQMEALNPELSLNETVTVTEDDLSIAASRFNCGWGIDTPRGGTNRNNCNEGMGYLRSLGGGDANCCVARSRPDRRSCARVSCSWGCGIFLCNKKVSESHCVLCRHIANDADAIMDHCTDMRAGGHAAARDFNTHYIGVGGAPC